MIAFRCILALVGGLALPGLAIALMVNRDDDAHDRFVALAVTFGLGVWFVTAELLAHTVGITPTMTTVVVASEAIASAVVIAWHRRALPRWGSGWLSPLGAVVAPLIAGWPLVRVSTSRPDALLGSTPWYYWHLASQVIDNHHIPSKAMEWGIEVGFLNAYPAFTTATAGLSAVARGGESLTPAHFVAVLALLAAGTGLWLLGRAWGAPIGGAAVAVAILFASIAFSTKLSSYRPEAMGYGLMFLALAHGRWWLTTRTAAHAGAATVALMALSQVHGIVLAIALALLAGTLGAGLVSAQTSGPRLRTVVSLLGVVAAGLAIVAVVGRISGVGEVSGIPRLAADGSDPTLTFFDLTGGIIDEGATNTRSLLQTSLKTGFLKIEWQWHAVAAAIVVLCIGAFAVRRKSNAGDQARAALVMLVLSSLVIAAAAAVFTYRWSTYVPRRTGVQRMVRLWPALFAIAVAMASAVIPGRGRRVASIGGVALAILLVVHTAPPLTLLRDQLPSKEQLALLQSLDFQPSDVVLANSYTESFLPLTTGGQGLLDGRAPYLESDLLDRANRLLQDSADFFADPEHSDFDFEAEGVTYVLVATARWALMRTPSFATDPALVARRPDLEKIAEVPGLVVFRVRHQP